MRRAATPSLAPALDELEGGHLSDAAGGTRDRVNLFVEGRLVLGDAILFRFVP